MFSDRGDDWASRIALDQPTPYITWLAPRSEDGGALPYLNPSAPGSDVGEGQKPAQQASAAVSGIALLLQAVQARLEGATCTYC